METSLQATAGDIPNTKQVFLPQETLDHPFDVTLVIKNGKEFKAHRRVLSEASPFFERLLKSDMKEAIEGIIHLEMIHEECLSDILEFIYTGRVQIPGGENCTRDLIAMADYLVLPHLKTIAEKVLVDKLNVSNSVSAYYFADSYQCEDLFSISMSLIFTNFSSVANTKDFLSLSCKEVKRWISSDEIYVDSEEDVFNIILAWIDHDNEERKKYFADLFCEVRLVYLSLDFLCSGLLANDLVNNNEQCLHLVMNAVKLSVSQNHYDRNVRPRKSLEISALLICVRDDRQQDQLLCYSPTEDEWSCFPSTVPSINNGEVISCDDKLYFISQSDGKLLCYDSFYNCWTSLPFIERRRLHQFFVRNDKELCALVSEDQDTCSECLSLSASRRNPSCGKKHNTFIMKYKPESNTWEDMTVLDLGSRVGICIVAQDNFIYFLGGYAENRYETLKDADRYNLSTNTWEKIADILEPRQSACGAAACGRIFIAGGVNRNNISESCEVYNETTNEWHFIASLNTKTPWDTGSPTLLCVDNKMYLLFRYIFGWNEQGKMGCLYELDNDECRTKTQIPNEKMLHLVRKLNDNNRYFITFSCSLKVFKESNFLKQTLLSNQVDKTKCAVM